MTDNLAWFCTMSVYQCTDIFSRTLHPMCSGTIMNDHDRTPVHALKQHCNEIHFDHKMIMNCEVEMNQSRDVSY